MSQSDLGASFYHDLAQLTGDVFWVMRSSPDPALEFMSDGATDLFGHTPEDFVEGGAPFMLGLVDPRDLPDLRRELSRTTDRPGYAELRFRHRQGHTVFTRMWFRRRVREDGSTVVEGVNREVTALSRLESALRESEDRFRNAMRFSAVAMCLVSPTGRFTEVNTALCDLLGRDETTLRSTTWQELTHPDDLDSDVTLVDEVLTGIRENYRLLKRFLRPDGEVVWGDMSVSCVRAEDGGVRYFVTQIVDITAQKHMERELRASEEQYRVLVEESSDFLLRTVGQTGRIAWVSPSMTRTLGWEAREVVGRQALDFLHPDDWPDARIRRERMDAGDQSQGRLRVLCADGTYKWMLQMGRTLLDDDGTPIGRISSFKDIDEQVRAEQALAQSQAELQADRIRLRATMDAMLDPHFVIAPVRDDSGAIVDFIHVDANAAGLEHAGFTREQFIGSSLLELVPGQEAFIDLYAHAFETGEPLVQDALRFDPPPGMTGARLFDVRGVRVGDALSVTVRDATERVHAAQALAESQARYRLLAENASDVVYRVHIDGTIQWLSDGVTRIVGLPPTAFIGRDIDEFVHAPDQDDLDAAVDQALVTGRATVRFRLVLPDGHLHWMEATIHPFDGPDDETILVGGCRDVHAEMQAVAELDRRARTDNLTRLPNREEAMSRLRALLSDSHVPVAVGFLDLDNFKTINDTHGHAVGDAWLRDAAGRIRTVLEDHDLVARVGGDEILIALPGLDRLQPAIEVAERLREQFVDQDALSTVSIGVTLARPGEDVDAVIARADQAMYRAKQAGRNKVVGA